MHVFVTGGAGYIGSVCTECLLDAGHRVTVFDDLSEGHAEAVDSRARLIVGNLNSVQDIMHALGSSQPDAVFHLAASALVGESMTNPSKYFRNNVSAGITLLEAMMEVGIKRLVFSSSCATYGLPERIPIRENFPQHPINPYGESKLQFERLLPWYHRAYGLNYVGLRFFNVAGATAQFGEAHRVESHLIPNVLRVALGQQAQIQICGDDYETADGTCVRDFVHVADIAQAHMTALTAERSGFYNLGTGHGHSIGEVIACARQVTGHSIPVETIRRRPGDPAILVADASAIDRELQWRPAHPGLREIIESAWAWHSRHPFGYK